MNRHALLITCALAASVSRPSHLPAAELDSVLSEDFAGASPIWGRAQRAGQLRVDKGSLLTPIDLSDFVIEYDTMTQGVGISEICFRMDDAEGRYYMFRVDSRGQTPGFQAGFLMAGPGRELPWWLVGERLGHTAKPNTWVHVKIEAIGSRMVGYLDGKEAARYTDDTLRKGALGFRQEICTAAFDNLKIYVPKGAPYYIPTIRRPMPTRPQLKHNPFLNPDWTAHWIWADGDPNDLDRWMRKTLSLPEKPHEARIAVTADNAYSLYVNGRLVGSDGDWYSLETYDIVRHLRPGDNVIAAHVHNEGPGAAGLLLEGWVHLPDGTALRLVSDPSWKASPTSQDGWEQVGFDDRGWTAAKSIGRHPCPPWGDQSDLALPFLGPKQPVKLVQWAAPGRLVPGEAIDVAATFVPTVALTHDYPLVVRALTPAGPVDLGHVWPQPATREWLVGKTQTVKASLPIAPRLWYLVGQDEIRVSVELRGTALLPGGAPAERTARFAPPADAPRPDWRLRAGRAYCKGAEHLPIDDEGVYFFEVQPGQPPMPQARTSLPEIVAEYGFDSALRCRLVDTIDCTKTDHDFSDDYGLGGRSRVLDINGKRYRVTSARRRLSYFFYTLSVRDTGEPHVLVAETPNDVERYTTIRVYPQETNPGCGIYTGREYPCDGQSVLHTFLFYPQRQQFRLSVSRLPVEVDRRPESGAAVSRIWVFQVLDPIAASACRVVPPARGPQRRLGMYLTAPSYIYSLYGFPSNTESGRRASVHSFVDYMKFCGMNLLEFNAIDGGDIAGRAYYDSEVYKPARHDVFRDLLPVTEREDIQVVPIVTSLACPSWRRTVDKEHQPYPGWSELSYQWDKDGRTRTSFFAMWLPDPLRPEVQELLFRCLREICERAKAYRCVPAIGFRVNGKIGLCYAGSRRDRNGQDTGYSPWNIAEFEKDTSIDVPDVKPTPYAWLRENAWEQWIDWRCRRMRDFWLRARKLVQGYRPDWKLMVSCDLPSETPGYNIEWPRGERPLDLMRYHGYDPRLFANEPGLLIQRGMMIAADRYWTTHPTYGQNVWAHKAFNYAPGVPELYRTPEGTACEFYHNYWEESGPGGGATFSSLAAGTMYPLGRYYFEPLAFSLERTNPHTMAVFSWERGSTGHEHDLRRFARAYRALAYVEPREFRGQCRIVSESPQLPPAEPISDKPQPMRTPYRSTRLWVKWFGDRLAVLNATDAERVVELTFDGPWAQEREVVELSTGAKVRVQGARARLHLRPYDLRVLAER